MAITPARRIVEAFGDCDALVAMYTEDVVWRLNHSLAPNIKGGCPSSRAVSPSRTSGAKLWSCGPYTT
eukprot:COSAG02_NODE_44094_length_369_cov_0.574074_1_plen_67_part_01